MTDDQLARACAEIMGIKDDTPYWRFDPLTEEHASAVLLERMVELGWHYMICNGVSLPGKGDTMCVFKKGDMRSEAFVWGDRKRAIAEAAVAACAPTPRPPQAEP